MKGSEYVTFEDVMLYGPPKTRDPNPADGAMVVDTWVNLSWTPANFAVTNDVYIGDNFDDVDNGAESTFQGNQTGSSTIAGFPGFLFPDGLVNGVTYYWRIDGLNDTNPNSPLKRDVWSFTTEGAVAALDPANGAVGVTQTPVLTWAPGLGASHDVYFSTDASALELKGSGNLGSESYDPGQLEWNTTNYWRVDEANNTNADNPWTGPLWSFTGANFLTIDDFESYNDINEVEPGSNRIYNAWVDGFDDPTNGSTVGHLDPPFYEETIVHNSNKSMPITYDNAVGKSETTYVLTSNRDWTVNGVNTVTIWYRGDSANAAEPMYVVLNDSAVVTNDNPDAAKRGSWTQWNINLKAFDDQGVNLANVTSITLSLGNRTNPTAGGSGMMYFDVICLYAPVP